MVYVSCMVYMVTYIKKETEHFFYEEIIYMGEAFS